MSELFLITMHPGGLQPLQQCQFVAPDNADSHFMGKCYRIFWRPMPGKGHGEGGGGAHVHAPSTLRLFSVLAHESTLHSHASRSFFPNGSQPVLHTAHTYPRPCTREPTGRTLMQLRRETRVDRTGVQVLCCCAGALCVVILQCVLLKTV